MLAKLEYILFFLTVLLLPTQLGRHFWPSFAYIYSLRIDYLSPTIYLWDILVLGLTLVSLFQGKRINRTGLNLILLFLLSQLVSLIPQISNAGVLGVGFTRLEEYFFACLFGLYIASSEFTFLKRVVFLPILLAVIGESLLSIVQFLKGGTLGLWILGERTFSLSTPGIAKFDFYGREFLRPYGTFPHPNVLAAFMVVTSVILSSLRKQGSINKIVNWIPAFAGMTILLTVSRVAILAGFLEALLLLGKTWKVALILAALFLSPILFTRFSSILNFDNLSLVRREELSQAAIQMWSSSPIFGIGLNNFIPKASDELLAGPSRFLQPVHNIFLLTLAETGILGLLGFLGLLGYPIFMLFKLHPKPYTLNPILIWAVILFLGLFDHYFLTLPQGYRLLFLVWGLSLSRLAEQAMLESKDAKSP